MVPFRHQMVFRQFLHIRKIQDHPIGGVAILIDRIPFQGDMQDITVPMHIPALAAVVWDAVSRIKFNFPCNRQHAVLKVSVNIYESVNSTSTEDASNRSLPLF